MKSIRTLGAALLLSGLVGAAFAQQPVSAAAPSSGLTRAQVIAEFERARSAGELLTENGQTEAELNPSRYPHHEQASGVTRSQVVAELDRARRDGDLLTENGQTLAEQNPGFYAAQRVRDGESRYADTSTLTRAQVIAEFDRARRDGDLLTENGQTQAEQNPEFYAAQRVRDGLPRYAMN